ncbi:hypothetical protein CSKR_202021, partial [Clonorchis sinensis]
FGDREWGYSEEVVTYCYIDGEFHSKNGDVVAAEFNRSRAFQVDDFQDCDLKKEYFPGKLLKREMTRHLVSFSLRYWWINLCPQRSF